MAGSKLYVGNLKYSVTPDELHKLFSGYGEVKSANVIEGKGFGFVEMGSPEQAEQAKTALNGQDFNGRALKIDEAQPPRQDNNRRGGFRRE
jgi:RNA recognition motif-containing protein